MLSHTVSIWVCMRVFVYIASHANVCIQERGPMLHYPITSATAVVAV